WLEELPDRRAITSADGVFTIPNVPLDTACHLVVRHEDAMSNLFRSRSVPVSVTSQLYARQVELGVQKADRAMTLIVRDEAGNPVPNGSVTAWGESLTTDASGRVTVRMPTNTTLDLLAAVAGKEPLVVPVTFEPAGPAEIGVSLQPLGSPNHPPLARLNAAGVPAIARGGELAFTVTSSDADGDALANGWSATAGTFVATGTTMATVRWRAPGFDTTATVTVVVTDGRGGRADAAIGISVGTGGFNQSPVASIVATGTRIEYATRLRLDAQTSDPDGDSVTCLWQAAAGSLESTTGTTTSWLAPSTTGVVPIWLTVTDARGAAVTTSLSVSVLPPNSPPTVAVTASAVNVLPLTPISMRAEAADPDGDPVTCTWFATDGQLMQDTGTLITWRSPASSGVATVTCVVEDGRGGQATGSWVFETSTTANNAPLVQVAAARTVTAEGVNVAVTATATDTDRDPLAYAWSATGGSFSRPTASVTEWIPGAGSQSYTLSCAVRDDRGKAATATLAIQVMQTLSLAANDVRYLDVTGTSRAVALPTPSGQERFGMVISSLDRTGTAQTFEANGGGTMLADVTRSPVGSVRPSHSGMPPGQAAVDAVMRGRAASNPCRYSAKTSIRASVRAADANVGDIHVFNVYTPSGYQARTARLAVIGTRCKVFIDRDPAGGYSPAGVTDAMMTEFASEFDARVWSFITANYGAPSNLTGDGKVTILFTPLVNTIGAAGFFDPVDLMPAATESNARDMFNMWVYDSGAGFDIPGWKVATVETLVHEFQHLVNSWAHMQQGVGEEAPWLNEALSVGAEVRYRNAADTRFADYAVTPEQFPLLPWPDGATVANYGCVGLFGQYLYDRLGTDTIRAMVGSVSSGTANVEAHAGGLTFDQVFREWGVAMYRNSLGLSGQPGDYRLDVGLDDLKKARQNFGTSWTGVVTGAAFRFIEYVPNAGYAQPFTTLSIADPGTGSFTFSITRISN
ncbi:MAG TPA: hypothetical protein VIV61_09345, partial [Candidatus Ozemobacteraceae bacterium]